MGREEINDKTIAREIEVASHLWCSVSGRSQQLRTPWQDEQAPSPARVPLLLFCSPLPSTFYFRHGLPAVHRAPGPLAGFGLPYLSAQIRPKMKSKLSAQVLFLKRGSRRGKAQLHASSGCRHCALTEFQFAARVGRDSAVRPACLRQAGLNSP